VLTEVSLKVLPGVAAQGMLTLDGLDDEMAVAAMAASLSSPYEVTGVAHDPQQGKTMFRLEGFLDSVAYRAEALTKHLAKFGTATFTHDAGTVQDTWAAIRDVTALANQTGDVWRLSVKPSDAPGLVAKMGAKAVQYDWGGGLIWALTDEGRDLRATLGDFGGHATLVRGKADVPTFQPEPAPLAVITAGLRAKFDPRGILNPGIMS
jgi:glycolate oxidase FAD binding subunit